MIDTSCNPIFSIVIPSLALVSPQHVGLMATLNEWSVEDLNQLVLSISNCCYWNRECKTNDETTLHRCYENLFLCHVPMHPAIGDARARSFDITFSDEQIRISGSWSGIRSRPIADTWLVYCVLKPVLWRNRILHAFFMARKGAKCGNVIYPGSDYLPQFAIILTD